ncbi:ethanolamine ammonia-lyase [Niastella yeongjuensis]|uniref:Ethanolamine ammonia-lyase small subunit n=1 Tax=Niastella yeongjuensis TaxID=354355 RepID=A0A1V9F198_9BACT|nr:ethanolamine ammonia-lyase subunit EutC [Niastella yeongjuensis]OQP52054.1 ethanolamine ammonia-lyase [Niastella yeongjuensis]SEP37050.1 Ethanolamine ammonia-lyase light chain [Niastella yeongjuensis]
MDIQKTIVQSDPWSELKTFTAARIALGRTGTAEPLQSLLAFRLAHANARDAVYAVLDQPVLLQELQSLQLAAFTFTTQAASRSEYLQYPDKGRRLHATAITQLHEFNSTGYDVCVVLADGLSATAINRHAMPVLKLLLPLFQSARLSVAPVCIVQEGRVAIGDECGHLLKAKLVVVLIGERPGLSSPDSLGAYLTYRPAPGLTDESRNCISNIRPEGLQYQAAAEKIFFLINESLRLQLSGVGLKDNGGLSIGY